MLVLTGNCIGVVSQFTHVHGHVVNKQAFLVSVNQISAIKNLA